MAGTGEIVNILQHCIMFCNRPFACIMPSFTSTTTILQFLLSNDNKGKKQTKTKQILVVIKRYHNENDLLKIFKDVGAINEEERTGNVDQLSPG